MPLCEYCAAAIKELYPQSTSSRNRQVVTLKLPILGQCDVNNCWVCFKLSTCLESEVLDAFSTWKTDPLSFRFIPSGEARSPKGGIVSSRIFVGVELDGRRDSGQFGELDFCFLTRTDLQELIGSKPANQAKDSFDPSLAKEWIDTCRKTHKLCNMKRECWYPTRLLHIISGDQARLILSEDHSPKGYYITLSHRWGNFQYTKLLTETLVQLQSVITVSHLPPAFQDAIKVATLLDIEYIWIDGLCIKQDPDDRSDWEVESLRMGKVYENAFLNISATLAVDGNEPLWRKPQRSPFNLSEMTLRIDETQDVFYLLDGDIWIDEITSAPLNKRGWVFQERFLAKRVLHFSTRQLGWECQEMTALEMLPKGLPAILGRPVTKNLIQSVLSKAPDAPNSSIEEWLGTWHNIVEEYSKSSFTFPADKLIAFAGIGSMISEKIGTEYISGMLLGSLIYDLAWWRWMEDRTRFPLLKTCTRAPSWSWASVDGEINFPMDGAKLENSRTFIKNIRIIREGNDLLENHSRLRIQGVCMPLRVTWSEGDIFEFSISELSACKFTTEGKSGASSIDCDIPLEEMRYLERRSCILLLPLYSTTRFFYSLLIHRKRAGVRIDALDWSLYQSRCRPPPKI